MTKQIANCSCGQLSLVFNGTISKTSICHCHSCQKRTGSAFGMQTRLKKEQVELSGKSNTYTQIADSGNPIQFSFCPECGNTLFWELNDNTDTYIVALGAFTSSEIPAPSFSVYESRKHDWLSLPESITEHWD